MTTIVTRAGKGARLSWVEGDANFTNLNNDKLEINPALGTPVSGILTNTTGLPISTGVAGLGTGVATALAVNIGSAGAPVVLNGAGGTPSSLVGTNITGTAAGLTAGNVTTNANLTGHVTSTGNAAVLGSFTLAQLNTAVSDADVSIGEGALTNFFYPSADQPFLDKYCSGWMPSWFNQQWGGAQWGTLPDGSFGSVATGSIEVNGVGSFTLGNAASVYYDSQGFKVSESLTNPVAWIKINKVGNPSSAVTVSVRADSGGSPTGADLMSGTIAARTITSKTDGEWYPVALTGTLSSNTQYHLVMTQGTTDASNYYNPQYTSTRKYPHGFTNTATSAPVWTQQTGFAFAFLIQNPAANSLIQSGGMFDYKLAFNNGTPVNQSRSVTQPLANFYDGKNCSVLHRGTYAASSNIWDFAYGLDHDRITLTINSSGYPVLTLYESDRTVATVTGTGSVTSGNHDVGIRVRTVGDGADYLTLYVDGVSVGTPLTAQTFTMDVNMAKLGTVRLGDGFGIIPAWTQDMQMTSLPSAQGWTWTGTATEASAMSVAGGKLYQNANGYTSTQTGYYAKTVALVNATGWVIEWKHRAATSPNTLTAGASGVYVNDGTKAIQININEYFVEAYGAATNFVVQGDFKSQEHAYVLQGKGSDYYLFIDGKLAIDGTGKFTTAGASNIIWFGDITSTASTNADTIWSYVKYYQGGMLLPTANAGTCSEFAHWSGDKSALFPSLWNSGAPVSVKQLCGVPKNYAGEPVVQRLYLQGVTQNPTTTSTALAVMTDLEGYAIGSQVSAIHEAALTNSAAGNTTYIAPIFDGNLGNSNPVLADVAQDGCETANRYHTAVKPRSAVLPLGLRKVEGRWANSAGTSTTAYNARNLTVEARS